MRLLPTIFAAFTLAVLSALADPAKVAFRDDHVLLVPVAGARRRLSESQAPLPSRAGRDARDHIGHAGAYRIRLDRTLADGQM